MRPYLLKEDATSFNTNGFGPLNKCVKCDVTENLGDAPTLEMEILADDPLFQNIMVGSIIVAEPNKTDPRQAFVVEQISKPINGVVSIYATHIAQHRGKLIPVSPFTAANLDAALAAMATNSLETNPFTLTRDPGKNNVTATMAPEVPASFRELMGGMEGSVLDVYGGEWGYNNFEITLYNKRGHDNGVRVMYGKNMTDFKATEEFGWNDSATGCLGYWKNEETIVVGSVQYSAYVDDYPYNKTVVVDFSDKFQEKPTAAQVNAQAAAWISGKGIPSLTMEVALDHLQMEGGQSIAIGDTVHVYSGQYNMEAERRIVGMVYDVLADEYKTVTIGNLKTTLNQAISGAVSSGSETSGAINGQLFYGEVDATSTSTAFTAQIPGVKSYEKGLAIVLKNGVVTSASGYTININGLGALPVYRSTAAATQDTTYFNANYTMMFVYEERVPGGDWLLYMGYDSNTNTIGYQLRTNSRTIPVNGQTGRYRLLFSSQTNIRLIPANTSSSTSATAAKTVNQTPINPFGEILYYSSTTILASGATPGTGVLWQQYTLTLGYSFNRTGAALTLTANAPVYIKCAPQSDGSAIIDASDPFVQALPSSEDGKIYIYLGTAYSATAVEMVAHHPVYEYKSGGIRLYTGG